MHIAFVHITSTMPDFDSIPFDRAEFGELCEYVAVGAKTEGRAFNMAMDLVKRVCSECAGCSSKTAAAFRKDPHKSRPALAECLCQYREKHPEDTAIRQISAKTLRASQARLPELHHFFRRAVVQDMFPACADKLLQVCCGKGDVEGALCAAYGIVRDMKGV